MVVDRGLEVVIVGLVVVVGRCSDSDSGIGSGSG